MGASLGTDGVHVTLPPCYGVYWAPCPGYPWVRVQRGEPPAPALSAPIGPYPVKVLISEPNHTQMVASSGRQWRAWRASEWGASCCEPSQSGEQARWQSNGAANVLLG